MSRGGAPGGGTVVLDVAQLEALLTRTFSIGPGGEPGSEPLGADVRGRVRAELGDDPAEDTAVGAAGAGVLGAAQGRTGRPPRNLRRSQRTPAIPGHAAGQLRPPHSPRSEEHTS